MRSIRLAIVILFTTLSLALIKTVQAEAIAIPRGKIAFQSNRDQLVDYEFHIYVMNTDGTNVTQLTTEGDNWYPSFSPDGKYIAFCSYDSDGDKTGLYIMDADGSNVRRITRGITPLYRPAWSPDGKRLAFTYSNEIYTVNLDGTSLTNLTNHPASDQRPSFSPDGEYIVFGSNREDVEHDMDNQIWIMRSDGSNPVKLTSFQNSSTFPAWSPDGKYIAFSVLGEAHSGLYLIDIANQYSMQLLSTGFYWMASWSPDSRYIAVEGSDGSDEIGIVDAAMGKTAWITDNEFDDSYPSWAPN